MKKVMILGVGLAMLNLTSCKKGEEDPGMSLKSRAGRLAGSWNVTEYSEKTTSTREYEDDADWDGDLIKSEETEETTYDGSSVSFSSTSTDTYDGKDNGWNNGEKSRSEVITASGTSITIKNTRVDNDGSSTEEQTGTYSGSFETKITFEKDGTFSMTRINGMSGTFTETDTDFSSSSTYSMDDETTITGTWSFLNKNKADEYKNKERVALWFNSNTMKETEKQEYSYSWTGGGTSSGSDTDVDETTVTSTSTDPDEVWEFVMLSSKESKVVSMSTWSRDSKYTSTEVESDGSTTNTNTYTSTGKSSGTTEISMTMTKE